MLAFGMKAHEGRMQTQCLRIPLIAGKTPRFLDWVSVVRGREREAFEAMSGEGAVAEAIMLERGEAGDWVVYYMRARDLERAAQVFAASQLPIDRETRAMIEECWDVARIQSLEVLLDLHPPQKAPGASPP
jgi:uncharacterized protein DUF6176